MTKTVKEMRNELEKMEVTRKWLTAQRDKLVLLKEITELEGGFVGPEATAEFREQKRILEANTAAVEGVREDLAVESNRLATYESELVQRERELEERMSSVVVLENEVGGLRDKLVNAGGEGSAPAPFEGDLQQLRAEFDRWVRKWIEADRGDKAKVLEAMSSWWDDSYVPITTWGRKQRTKRVEARESTGKLIVKAKK